VSVINWDNKPEWADVWIEDLAPECAGDWGGWHRETDMKYIDKDDCYWFKIGTDRDIKVHHPPSESQWNGPEYGLPPVGIRVELHNDLGYDISYLQEAIGAEVTVKAAFYSGDSDVPMAAIETDDKECGCFRVSMMRPIRTEEDKEIAAMEMDAGGYMLGSQGCEIKNEHMAMCVRKLYRAGYRKQEEPK
jgi:hypothetical protein